MEGQFAYPNMEEMYTVNLKYITMLLPEPKNFGATKRQ